jgi:hypothetical protein
MFSPYIGFISKPRMFPKTTGGLEQWMLYTIFGTITMNKSIF